MDTQIAKEALLKLKELRSLLFIELDDGNGPSMLVLVNFPASTTARRAVLKEHGAEFGGAHKGRYIKQLWLFIEGKDPNRVEVLMVQSLDVIPPKFPRRKPSYRQTWRIIDILRDGSGDLVDLLPRDEEGQILQGVLEYFLAGFESARMSKRRA